MFMLGLQTPGSQAIKCCSPFPEVNLLSLTTGETIGNGLGADRPQIFLATVTIIQAGARRVAVHTDAHGEGRIELR